MKKQIGVIVPDEGMHEAGIEARKQGFRDEYENVDPSKKKNYKVLTFLKMLL